LSYLANGQTNRQTDKQTNKLGQKHYLLGGGNYLLRSNNTALEHSTEKPYNITQKSSEKQLTNINSYCT